MCGLCVPPVHTLFTPCSHPVHTVCVAHRVCGTWHTVYEANTQPFSPSGDSRGSTTSAVSSDAFKNLGAAPGDDFAQPQLPVTQHASNEMDDVFGGKIDQTIDSILSHTLDNAKTGNIFELVAAALEKQRVATGLMELRTEVKTLRQKNINLRMQLDEMEKMMDANIEDRERVIQARNEQVGSLRRGKEEVEAELYSANEENTGEDGQTGAVQ